MSGWLKLLLYIGLLRGHAPRYTLVKLHVTLSLLCRVVLWIRIFNPHQFHGCPIFWLWPSTILIFSLRVSLFMSHSDYYSNTCNISSIEYAPCLKMLVLLSAFGSYLDLNIMRRRLLCRCLDFLLKLSPSIVSPLYLLFCIRFGWIKLYGLFLIPLLQYLLVLFFQHGS